LSFCDTFDAFLVSFGALMFTMGFVLYMHKYQGGGLITSTGLVTILFVMFVLWRDVIWEDTLVSCERTLVEEILLAQETLILDLVLSVGPIKELWGIESSI
jgi:hypothetical protein